MSLLGLLSGFPVSSSGSRTALAIAAGARTQVYSLVAGGVRGRRPVRRRSAVSRPALGRARRRWSFYAASKLVSWQEFRRLGQFRTTELLLAAHGRPRNGPVRHPRRRRLGDRAQPARDAVPAGSPPRGRARPGARPAGHARRRRLPRRARPCPGWWSTATTPRCSSPTSPTCAGGRLLAVDQENAAFPEHPVRWFVLNVEANVEVDITAADGLRGLHEDLAERGVRLGLARVKTDLRHAAGAGRADRPDRRGHALPHPAGRRGGLPGLGDRQPATDAAARGREGPGRRSWTNRTPATTGPRRWPRRWALATGTTGDPLDGAPERRLHGSAEDVPSDHWPPVEPLGDSSPARSQEMTAHG